jgi:hypothetical protein
MKNFLIDKVECDKTNITFLTIIDMKKLYLFILLLLSLASFAQNKATYDSYQYYFYNSSWNILYTNKTKISLHLIIYGDSAKSLWIENKTLKIEEFAKLMNYVDSIPNLSIGSRSFSSKDKEYRMDSFSIYWKKKNSEDTDEDNTNKDLNIVYVREKIKDFFK